MARFKNPTCFILQTFHRFQLRTWLQFAYQIDPCVSVIKCHVSITRPIFNLHIRVFCWVVKNTWNVAWLSNSNAIQFSRDLKSKVYKYLTWSFDALGVLAQSPVQSSSWLVISETDLYSMERNSIWDLEITWKETLLLCLAQSNFNYSKIMKNLQWLLLKGRGK